MAKRISFFIGTMHGGGAERVISILANHYCEKGWDVDICLLLDHKVQYELNRGIRIVDLTQVKGPYYKNAVRWMKSIRKHVRRSKPDVIVSFIGRINALVILSCIGINTPIVVSERNDPKNDGRSKVELEICNWCYKRAKAVVYQTEYEKSCFSKRLGNGLIIGNPVEISDMPMHVERPFEIVTAGRLLPQKNHEMLIRAAASIRKTNPDVTLKIYGDGKLRTDLQALIESLGASEYITLLGNIKDLHRRINGAGVFVLCSEFEGLSNALIEAMMLGIPCISTNYPGANEIITHGKNGLIVPMNDTDRLTEAITCIFDDSALRSRLVEGALMSSERFEKRRVLKDWDRVIEGAVSSR